MLVVVSAIGPPRLWSFACTTLLNAVRKHCLLAPTEDADALARVLSVAHQALGARSDLLIERTLPDAALLLAILDGDKVHCASAGSSRLYVHRNGESHRLTPRDADGSLLDGARVTVSMAIEPGDLVMAGSSSAFSDRAVNRIVSTLQTDPSTPVTVLAALLTEPAAQGGVGAAAIVARVR